MDPSIENPRRNINNDNWNTLTQSAIKRNCQLQLLNLVTSDQSLFETKIISSTTPRIGKTFKYNDQESKKLTLLHETKRKIMDLAITEAERDLINISNNIKLEYQNLEKSTDHDLPTFYEFVKSTNTKYSPLRSNLNKKFNNKVSFHSKRLINKVNSDKPLTQNRHIYKLKTLKRTNLKRIDTEEINAKNYLFIINLH